MKILLKEKIQEKSSNLAQGRHIIGSGEDLKKILTLAQEKH